MLKNAFRLKGSKVGINEKFPAEINARRKVLLPILKQEMSKGNSAILVIEALIAPRAKFVVRGGKMVTDPFFTPNEWHKHQTMTFNPKYTDSLNNFVTRKEFPNNYFSSSGELMTERNGRP